MNANNPPGFTKWIEWIMNNPKILGLPQMYSLYSTGTYFLSHTKYGGFVTNRSYCFVLVKLIKSLFINVTLFLNVRSSIDLYIVWFSSTASIFALLNILSIQFTISQVPQDGSIISIGLFNPKCSWILLFCQFPGNLNRKIAKLWVHYCLYTFAFKPIYNIQFYIITVGIFICVYIWMLYKLGLAVIV